jgi:chlororespiratory reduction 6-like protein^
MPAASDDKKDQEKLSGLHVGATGSATPDLIICTALRNEVIAGDLAGVRKRCVSTTVRTPAGSRRAFQSLMFHVQGYDEDPRELYQIPECRAWFQSIDKTYPFLIYFLPCVQYTLYVGSQQNLDGARLSVDNLRSFFRDRDAALQELAQRIGEPYEVMKEKLLRIFRAYARLSWRPGRRL